MARVTVEDCTEVVPDRFDLVLFAARRAKQIATGGELTVERDNDKDSVVSLREIAGKTVAVEDLERDLIYSFSKRRFHEPRMDTAEEVLEDGNLEDQVASTQALAGSLADDDDFSADDESETLVDGDLPTGMSFGDDDVDVED